MKRILSALVLIIFLALPAIFGPPWAFFMVAHIAFIFCPYELFRVCLGPQAKILGWIVMIWTIPFIWFIYFHELTLAFYSIAIASLIIITIHLFLFEKSKANAMDLGFAFLGFIYPVMLISFWILIRNGVDGRFWMIFGLLSTFISDAGAYYFGKSLGKHHLSKRLSPKKTWEGLFGGLITSIVAGIAYIFIYNAVVTTKVDYPLWLISVLAGSITILGLIGDLSASMFKREFEVKDMGNLIPGHGGMLDRLDGVIPVGVVLYLVIQVIG